MRDRRGWRPATCASAWQPSCSRQPLPTSVSGLLWRSSSRLRLPGRMFSNGTRLQEAAVDLAAKREALDAVPGRIEAERKHERVTLAGALHDEVLQPLYKVHLMAQVLRQDLAGGR